MSPQRSYSSYGRRGRRRWPRRLGVVVAILLIVVLSVGGVGWYYSGQLLAVDHTPGKLSLQVTGARAGTVTLARNADTVRPGLYGLAWPNGHGELGDTVRSDARTVTRRLAATTTLPPGGTRARIDTDVYTGDPSAVGVSYQDVRIPGPLGALPAWYVKGTRPTWVILVHGRNVTRAQGLHEMPVLQQAGFPVLDVTYRNDEGAPPSKDRLLHLGADEWRDVEAAVRYARGHGARDVVLYGWSMGGAVVEAVLRKSGEASHVRGAVLDAPVLDWRATLSLQGSQRSLPGFLTTVAEWVTSFRVGIDFGDFDVTHRTPRVPTLLFHGGADDTVPIGPSEAYARAFPRQVTYVRVGAAGHVEAWNVDPAAYDRVLLGWLGKVAPG